MKCNKQENKTSHVKGVNTTSTSAVERKYRQQLTDQQTRKATSSNKDYFEHKSFRHRNGYDYSITKSSELSFKQQKRLLEQQMYQPIG
jgi:hypothetical protein